jgi:type III secretion protein V
VILERVVEWKSLRSELSEGSPWIEYARQNPLAFVRMGLCDQIADKASRGTNTVVVYLLDPALEHAIRVGSEGVDDTLLAACYEEFAHLPPTAARPYILTGLETRQAVQDLLRSEFPRYAVLAHEELPPATNVQPVARISAN